MGALYRYALEFRPAGIGTLPKGRGEAYPIEPRHPKIPTSRHGIAVYSEPLTSEEIKAFELVPVVSAEQLIETVAGDFVAAGYVEEYIALAETQERHWLSTVGQRIDRAGVVAPVTQEEVAAGVLAILRAHLAGAD